MKAQKILTQALRLAADGMNEGRIWQAVHALNGTLPEQATKLSAEEYRAILVGKPESEAHAHLQAAAQEAMNLLRQGRMKEVRELIEKSLAEPGGQTDEQAK